MSGQTVSYDAHHSIQLYERRMKRFHCVRNLNFYDVGIEKEPTDVQ